MRKDASLKRRLGHIATLQALKATSSRAELAEAQAAHAEATAILSARETALSAGVQEMDRLLAAEALDFDRWRISRAVMEDLARERDAADHERHSRENDEDECRASFGRENAREEHAATLHRTIARRLGEKRDEAATLEAGTLTSLRRVGGRQ